MKFAETLTASTKIFATFLFQFLGTSAQAQENPIDCEILICMAAAFPSASGCDEAFEEMIDRVTPWPIEAPLQIWNCPMSIPSQYGTYEINLSSSEYAFARSFRVFDVFVRDSENSQDDCQTLEVIEVGTYDSDGDFSWDDATRADVPDGFGLKTEGCDQYHRAVFIEWEDEEGTYRSQRINY